MTVLAPGWYWWLVEPRDAKAWGDFVLNNSAAAKGPLRVRMVFRGQNEKTEIPIFEVIGGGSLLWTLPTPAMKARKGINTKLSDLIQGPHPSPSLVAAVEDILGKPAAAAKEITSGLKLLAIGAGAILLVNLYRNTRPAPVYEPEPEEA